MTVEVSPKGKDYEALVRHFYKNAMTDWDVAHLCEALDAAVIHERRATVERIRERLERIAEALPSENFGGVYAILDEEMK